MDLASYVSFGTSSADYYNQRNQRFETYQITSPINVGARNRGIELGYQQPIAGHFGVSANYTYADGSEDDNVELVGASRNTYNVGAYYEDDRFSTRLDYNFRSDYLVGLDRSFAQHEAGVGTLSASFNYQVSDNVTLACEALNLNNPVLKYYGNNKDQPRAFYSNGRQLYLGLRIKM
jgi:iron complex outermembrane receptor protein